jgi:hypothetical protein
VAKRGLTVDRKRKASPTLPALSPSEQWQKQISSVPVQSVLGQFLIDEPIPFDRLIKAYQAEDQKLALRLSAALNVDEIMAAFVAVPCGSLHHFGKPILSEAELHRLSEIVALGLRSAGRAGLAKFLSLPDTLKRSAWSLLSTAEQARLVKQGGSR